MQSRRSGEPQSAISRASFGDRERLIFSGSVDGDEEAGVGFGLSDLTEDSDEEDGMGRGLNGNPNGRANGHVNGNRMVNGKENSRKQEYHEVPQKIKSPPLR